MFFLAHFRFTVTDYSILSYFSKFEANVPHKYVQVKTIETQTVMQASVSIGKKLVLAVYELVWGTKKLVLNFGEKVQ
jgi:hypothetical protein